MRVLALWSPDWPVTAAAHAARVPPHQPAAVFVAGRVLACSAVARAQGVRRGLRRREAQARCPELAVLTPDPDRDARAFEPVVVAVEELAPGVEILRPGLVALPARGPAGWFGGELAAAERLVDQVAARTGVEVQAGFADGLFAAVLAARRAVAVAPGDTPAFLAALGVEELDREPDIDRSDLVDLLRRLGLRSLGAFAALDPADVASRFGADAVLCHRLARGLDPRPPLRRRPPEELDRRGRARPARRPRRRRRVRRPRAGRAAARHPGGPRAGVHPARGHRPHGRGGGAAPDLAVRRAAHPRRHGRPGALAARRLADQPAATPRRDGCGGPPAAGAGGDRRRGRAAARAVGRDGEADERAGRALVRVQALLGPESVVTAVLGGGRDPAERVRLVPWGDERAEPDPPPRLRRMPAAPVGAAPRPRRRAASLGPAPLRDGGARRTWSPTSPAPRLPVGRSTCCAAPGGSRRWSCSSRVASRPLRAPGGDGCPRTAHRARRRCGVAAVVAGPPARPVPGHGAARAAARARPRRRGRGGPPRPPRPALRAAGPGHGRRPGARRRRRVVGAVAGVGPLVEPGGHPDRPDAGRPRRRHGAAAHRPRGGGGGCTGSTTDPERETAGRFGPGSARPFVGGVLRPPQAAAPRRRS